MCRAAWRELIAELAVQKRRLVEFQEWEADTYPNPGATEEQLKAAEARLGHPLDSGYRELLSIANGWQHFHISYTLLGTDDIGTGPRWETGLEDAETWFDDDWSAWIDSPYDPADYQLVVENDNGYSNNIFLFLGRSEILATGSAVPLPPEMVYPDLYAFLLTQLDLMTAAADQAVLGEDSEPWWGRNLRTDPPTIAEIVSKLAELSAIGNPDAPSPLRPGATDSELDALDRHLGGSLHPEHREVLSVSNGLSIDSNWLGEMLSTQEILAGTRWRDMLVRRQADDDAVFRNIGANYRDAGLPEPPPPAPVIERIGTIPAVPFAIAGTIPYGVDTRDGHVRDLLSDPISSSTEDRGSTRTVRHHLLHACWALWWKVGHPSRP